LYRGLKIAVAVAAFNEEGFVREVVSTIPSYVDRIYVVDDASTDTTADILAQLNDPRLRVLTHEENRGVGAANATAFQAALTEGAAIVATLAGDGQMDPSILHEFLDPIVEGHAEYTKGDRFSNPDNRCGMPRHRVLGTHVLNWLTRIASGYRHIDDAQGGYTALAASILRDLDYDRLAKSRYAYENEVLVQLHVAGARVISVSHPARYRGEKSSLRLAPFILHTSLVLLKGLAWRLRLEGRRKGQRQETVSLGPEATCPFIRPLQTSASITRPLIERDAHN